MIKINLLPYREKEKKDYFARVVFILTGTLVIFALLLAFVLISLRVSIMSLESKLKEAETALTELDKKIGDVDKVKVIKQDLEEKLGVINTLEENRLAPVKTLDSLAMLVPPKDIWLTKIVQTGDSLRLEGIGRDNLAVADFMKTIEKFDPIKSVDLVSSRKTEVAGTTLQQFTFACVMKKGF